MKRSAFTLIQLLYLIAVISIVTAIIIPIISFAEEERVELKATEDRLDAKLQKIKMKQKEKAARALYTNNISTNVNKTINVLWSNGHVRPEKATSKAD